MAYQRLQVVLFRGRLRIDMLLKIHATRIHPVGVISAITGYSTVASALDRVVVDLSETMDAWLVVEDLAPPRVRASSRRAVLALAGLLSHHDPTWYQLPGRRSAQRAADHARLEYAQHIRELDRLTQADAAPRARDRRDARRQRGGWASPS